MNSRISLFPEGSRVNQSGHLQIGGCDSVELVAEFGTPLYLFDETDLRARCNSFKCEFDQYYPDTTVIYACKAFINKALSLILKEEGLGLDVVSAGEMSIAQSAGFPMDKVYFHGNNKSADELEMAVNQHIRRIVVDNFHELELLTEIASSGKTMPDILLRLSPGIDPHTHKYIATGIIDSKFGFTLSDWDIAVAKTVSVPNLNLIGLHFHLGSLIFKNEPYREAIDSVLNFALKMKKEHNFQLRELDIGGGFAIQYTTASPAPPLSFYAESIAGQIKEKCHELKLDLPSLTIEPGRSLIGQSGVALYRVGVIKDIPGVRRYVSVDGGMSDNIRPALYGAQYEAIVANKAAEKATERVTVSGKFCESGDILIKDIYLPPIASGDIIAIPDCGAYCLPMASNYNSSLRPTIIMVREGKARLIRSRETFSDLTRHDLI
ncbi:diaminopimelate decarboxylase [Chloroflexota bacterium]